MHTLEQAELILARIQAHSGVQGILITTNEGTVIRSTLDNIQTQQYSNLIPHLSQLAKSAVRDLDPEDDLNILRIRSRKNEAIYDIGVGDSGQLIGLNPKDLADSLHTLKRMAHELGADVSVIREHIVECSCEYPGAFPVQDHIQEQDRGEDQEQNEKEMPGMLAKRSEKNEKTARKVAEVLVRKGLDSETHFLEIRVVVIGGANCGKSTFLGALSMSELDNGRGKSRLNLLRHRHEIITGRTSALSHQIIGFTPLGTLINHATPLVTTFSQICSLSSKIITFIDTPGHSKYQRTTLSGLTGTSPDYTLLLLNGNAGDMSEISKEHLGLALAIAVPVVVVITKIDLCGVEELTGTLGALFRVLKGPAMNRVPVVVENADDIGCCISSFGNKSVTGENLELFTRFLNLIPKSLLDYEKVVEDDVEFHVEEVYHVPGLLISGKITRQNPNEKTVYYIGPDEGRFVGVYIESIHRQRCTVSYIKAGQAGTCNIKFVSQTQKKKRKRDKQYSEGSFLIRRGQVILRNLPLFNQECGVVWEFYVELDVLLGSVKSGSQVVLFTGSVTQTVIVTEVFGVGKELKVGEQGVVRIKFQNEPQWLRCSWTVLIRQADTRCVGKITRICQDEPE